MYYAAEQGNVQALARLIERHADVTVANEAGWTPLHAVVSGTRTDHEVCLGMLLHEGASVRATTRNGETPLQLAQRRGALPTIVTLLQRANFTSALRTVRMLAEGASGSTAALDAERLGALQAVLRQYDDMQSTATRPPGGGGFAKRAGASCRRVEDGGRTGWVGVRRAACGVRHAACGVGAGDLDKTRKLVDRLEGALNAASRQSTVAPSTPAATSSDSLTDEAASAGSRPNSTATSTAAAAAAAAAAASPSSTMGAGPTATRSSVDDGAPRERGDAGGHRQRAD